jgi:phage FluMu gp28-like protein
MFLRGLEDPDYKSFQFTSYENTTIPEEEWEGITKELPELIYRQEIMAEFIEGGGVVFRNVDQILTSQLKDAQAGVSYIMGVDLAKYEDFTVISVAEVDTKKLVYLHRFNQIDWNYQKDYIKQISQQYNGCICYIDSTGLGDPVAEDLMKNNVPIVPVRITSLSKSQIIQNLQLMIENKQIELLNDPELRKEFGAFAYELSPSGNLRYGAPSGFHDDIVISIALLAFGLGGLGGATCVGFYTPMPGENQSESVWNEEE